MINGAGSPRGLSYSYDDGAGATSLPTLPLTMTSASAAGTAATHTPHLLHISTSTTTTVASPSSHHSPAGNAHSTSGSPSPRGTTGGSTNQACAACKYQRRKCNPDCPLAPYFPADQQRRFLHAHRLFGVSNILKTIRRLRPELCAEAMNSLIFQAEMRAQDPVGGCYRLILSLERQLEIERTELAALLHHLALCRHQAAAAAMPPRPDLDITSSNQQSLLLNADQEVVDALYANHQEVLQTEEHQPHEDQRGHSPQQHHGGEQQQLFDYFYYDTTTAGEDAASKPVTLDINVDAIQQLDYDDDQKVDMAQLAVHEELAAGHQHHLDVVDHKDYEMKAALLVDVFDMRQGVDVNADDNDVKAVDVNASINIDINAVDVNAKVDLNEELQEKDIKNSIATYEASQLTVESSQCRLAL